MSKNPLPEVRNSHLAAKLERERALKNYRQQSKKQHQQQEAGAMTNDKQAQVVTMKGEPITAQLPLAKHRGKPVPFEARDAIKREFDLRGQDEVARDLMALYPGNEHRNCVTQLRKLMKVPEHPFLRTWRTEFIGLARKYRNELPFPSPAGIPAAPVHSLAAPQHGTVGGVSVETITQIVVASVMSAMGKLIAPPPPPQLPERRDMVDRSPAALRRLVTMMHKQWADSLMDDHPGFDRSHAFAAAWQISYDAYEKETGISVQATAQAEQKATGRRTNGLDIIERNGDLARFIEIAETAWAA